VASVIEPVVVELVVAELVEASKRPPEKANRAGGFDRLSHRRVPILKINFRVLASVIEPVVVELVVAELVEASKHRNDHQKKPTKLVASTGSATGEYQY